MITPQTLKGFRDFLPQEALTRQRVIGRLKEVFEQYGFDPLETPALEHAETLLGKYGDEGDKLLYLFEDHGKRKVGLRYDQTVPTARVVAQYHDLPKPFKRYQIQPVWRAENTQKGRFREFLQCDADIIGTESTLADSETIAVAVKALQTLGFANITVLINDRLLFGDMSATAILIVDKLAKIGQDQVKQQLKSAGFDPGILDKLRASHPTERLTKILKTLPELGVSRDSLRFDPTLARGLDYYTSTIFEIQIGNYEAGSVAGGGRYDKLIGQFIGEDIPAVGFALGFDRILEAMSEQKLLSPIPTATAVLVTVFSPKFIDAALYTTTKLREAGINADVTLDPEAKLDKQLKYADKKGIPYAVIQGPNEIENQTLTVKNLRTQAQETVTLEALIQKFSAD